MIHRRSKEGNRRNHLRSITGVLRIEENPNMNKMKKKRANHLEELRIWIKRDV